MHISAVFSNPMPNPTNGSDCELLFQTENENLRLGLSDDGFYNELFNQTGLIDHVVFMQGQLEQSIILVLTPNPLNSSFENSDNVGDVPTSLRDFQGLLTLSIDDSIINYPIRGRLCSSVMTCDRSELSFEDCEPNRTYVREFSVRNK